MCSIPAPMVRTLSQAGTMVVEGKTWARVCNHEGMAEAGQERPVRNKTRGDKNTTNKMECSRRAKKVDSAMPKKITASKKGSIKARAGSQLVLSGSENQ